MPKVIDQEEKRKWRVYLASPQRLALSADLIRALAQDWRNTPLDPDISPIVLDVDESGVRLEFKDESKHYSRLIPFHEIIAADDVTWALLDKGQAPESDDFRNPDPEIGVTSISYKTYAPLIARRVRQELLDLSAPIALFPADGDTSDSIQETSFKPLEDDRRRLVARLIRERQGQPEFRNALRVRYGDRCLVTGCTVLAILEAAHIKSYRGRSDNHPENGLLLRADIHTLFDLHLLGVEPVHLRIELHPDVASDPDYKALVGKVLECPTERRPSQRELSVHYHLFQLRLKSVS